GRGPRRVRRRVSQGRQDQADLGEHGRPQGPPHRCRGLLPDGPCDCRAEAVMSRAAFFASVRKSLFNGRMGWKQVEGCERILDECKKRGVTDPGHVAYILATAFHETARTM